MYLTAHRVRSPLAKVGINCFLYEHGDEIVEGLSWDNPNLRLISEQHPGRLRNKHIEVQPGGNEVLSYFDLAARDGTPTVVVEEGLRHLRQLLKGRDNALFAESGLELRFTGQLGIVGREFEELDALAGAAMALFRTPGSVETIDRRPLIVRVEHTQQERIYSLDEESQRRLLEIHEGQWRPARIHIDYTTAENFRMQHGNEMPNVIPTLTGLDWEKVLSVGGARFVDGQGVVLYEWPVRS